MDKLTSKQIGAALVLLCPPFKKNICNPLLFNLSSGPAVFSFIFLANNEKLIKKITLLELAQSTSPRINILNTAFALKLTSPL